jgi:small ligand-binding sensory domain FIST
MRLTQSIIIAGAATIALFVSLGPAMAHGYNATTMVVPALHSYSGAWAVTVTRSQRSNGTGCLTLNGSPSSGSATLVFEDEKYPYGSFLVLNGILVATIQEPLYGQNGALMFIASAKNGHIGQGVFENIEGGSNFDAGELAFGTKNSC